MLEEDTVNYLDRTLFDYEFDEDLDFLKSISTTDKHEITSELNQQDFTVDKQLSTGNKTTKSIEMLKRKRKQNSNSLSKPLQLKKSSKYYRELEKSKHNDLLKIKEKLLLDIMAIQVNPIDLLINTLPLSLIHYKSVLYPEDQNISFESKQSLIDYGRYLQGLKHTLEDVYRLKWKKKNQLNEVNNKDNNNENNIENEDKNTIEQIQLIKYITALIPLVDNMRRYYCFISKFK